MDLEGCEIKMPETVFFQEGKPLFIAQTEKDGKMSKHNKWDCKAIRLKFTEFYITRKKDTQTVKQLMGVERAVTKNKNTGFEDKDDISYH